MNDSLDHETLAAIQVAVHKAVAAELTPTALQAPISQAVSAAVSPLLATLNSTHDSVEKLKAVLIGDELKPEESIVWRVKVLEDWRRDVNAFLSRATVIFTPVVIAIILAILTFIWALLENRVDIIYK